LSFATPAQRYAGIFRCSRAGVSDSNFWDCLEAKGAMWFVD
jgi:hypothetical protein